MLSTDEIKKKRFQFLHKLHELSQGNEDKHFSLLEIGEQLGFVNDLTENIGQYLRGEGLIKFEDFDKGDGIISITHLGVVEIEKALSKPKEPTDYFPPVFNIISIGQMKDSQIQQASPGGLQLLIKEEQYEKIKELIESLKDKIDQLGLQVQQKSDLQSEILTIEAQMSSSKPKNTIIPESLNSVLRILEGVASNIIAYGFIQHIKAILGG